MPRTNATSNKDNFSFSLRVCEPKGAFVYGLSPEYDNSILNIPKRDWEGKPVVDVESLDGNENVKHIHVPEGVVCLGYNAFAQMKALESVDIPNSLQCLHQRAFASCVALTSLKFGLDMDDVRSAQDCFSYCVSLEKVEFQGAIDCLPDYMFRGCASLECVVYPPSVTSLGKGLFEGCGHLRAFVVNENVRHIGEGIFTGCIQLETIVCTEDTRDRLERNRAYFGIPEETNIVSFEQYAERHKPTAVKQSDDGLDM